MAIEPFADRRAAGVALAGLLQAQCDPAPLVGAVVLALPRGGVPVAYEIARLLGAQLDVLAVRKLGVPGHQELAMGAIAMGGRPVLNDEVVDSLHIEPPVVAAAAAREETEMERQTLLYRQGRAAPVLEGHTVILVDDGLATGATMRAAVGAVQWQHAAQLIVAVPVAERATCAALADKVDQVVCVHQPRTLQAVGLWYRDFSQTSDDEVCALLQAMRPG